MVAITLACTTVDAPANRYDLFREMYLGTRREFKFEHHGFWTFAPPGLVGIFASD
jgi:hypothetical protein